MKLDLSTLRGLDAFRGARAELVARLSDIDAEAAGAPLSAEALGEFEEIAGEGGLLAQVDATIKQLEIREQVIKDAAGEPAESPRVERTFSAPNVVKVPENIYDMAAYRQRAKSLDDLPRLLKDGAKRAIDAMSFPLGNSAKGHEQLIDILAKHGDDEGGKIARHIIGTSDPAYVDAYAARVSGKPLSGRPLAILQSYSATDGEEALPVAIDPTFINTSDGSVNPLRAMARVETISGKAWHPVTTAGVTAAYVGERTTTGASDGAPTDFGGADIEPIRADVAVDVSMEYLQDYGSAALLSELGTLISDAKDTLEATEFVMGDGSGNPDGVVAALITDTTSIVETATDNVYVLDDLDALIAALGPRFRRPGRASFLANLAILQYTRGFGDAGQTAGSIYDPVSKILRGYPAFESPAMDDTVADAKEIVLFGDFKAGFVIVDRLGLMTRVVDSRDTNGRPTGNSTIYAAWRNTSKLLFPNAFRLLKVK
jgi:HK97 family phage major capsid protein